MIIESEEKRQALIADCKYAIAFIESHLKRTDEPSPVKRSQLQRQQIALASLEAKELGYTNGHRLISETEAKPSLDYAKSKCTKSGLRKVYDAPPVPVIKPVEVPKQKVWTDYLHEANAHAKAEAANKMRDEFILALRAAGYEVKE